MRRILFTSALAVAVLAGTAVPASAATVTRWAPPSRCTVEHDSAGRPVLICIAPPLLRLPRRV